MNIDVIAAQIRTLCPVFNGSVAGAAAYVHGIEDQAWLPLPACYVMPLGQEADENTSLNGLQQMVHERVGVVIVLETLRAGGALDLADRRGQAASANLDTIRAALFRALLNWRPDFDPTNLGGLHEARGLYFVGASFPELGAFDRARFFYQFTFGLDTTISDLDGWQPPSDPLIEVQGTVTNGPGGETIALFDVALTP